MVNLAEQVYMLITTNPCRCQHQETRDKNKQWSKTIQHRATRILESRVNSGAPD